MTSRELDSIGSLAYPTGQAGREHIVPVTFDENGKEQKGIPYFRERIAARIGGKTIKDVFLYEPDTKEVPLVAVPPTVKFGGVLTNGNLYMGEAAATAQSGRQYVTWITNRYLPLHVQLFDKRHRSSAYLRTAQNGKAVVDATLRRTGYEKVRTSGHSYAGKTMSEFLAYYGDKVEDAVFQDPAGLAGHSMNFKSLLNDEVGPAIPYFRNLKNLPPQAYMNTLRHITDNPVLAVRELGDLGFGHPDMRTDLKRARDLGVRVGLLQLGKSAFFNSVAIKEIVEKEKLFDIVDGVPDAFHIAPNINPVPIVEAQNKMFDSLAELETAA